MKLAIDKTTRKLWRLCSKERYSVKKIDKMNSFEVFTKDLEFRAFVDNMGTIIYSKSDNYNKVDFYKLRNFCKLLSLCHFKI